MIRPLSLRTIFGITILAALLLSAGACKSRQHEVDREVEPVKVVFSMGLPEEDPLYKEVEKLYTEAFNRLGYTFELITAPTKRSLIDADSGVVDGDAARVFNVNEKNNYPSLLRVEEPIRRVKLAVYSNNRSLTINSWDDLKGLNIAYIEGVKFLEERLAPYNEDRNVATFFKPAVIFKKMLDGEVDVYIDREGAIEAALEQEELTSIVEIAVLEEIDLYPYLHRSNRHLVDSLEEVLREMKSDGKFEELLAE